MTTDTDTVATIVETGNGWGVTRTDSLRERAAAAWAERQAAVQREAAAREAAKERENRLYKRQWAKQSQEAVDATLHLATTQVWPPELPFEDGGWVNAEDGVYFRVWNYAKSTERLQVGVVCEGCGTLRTFDHGAADEAALGWALEYLADAQGNPCHECRRRADEGRDEMNRALAARALAESGPDYGLMADAPATPRPPTLEERLVAVLREFVQREGVVGY